MLKKILLIFVLVPNCIFAQQKNYKKLQQQIETLIKNFRGDIGISIKSLTTGKTIQINADTIFPTASMVKVPILIGVMDKINKGELNLEQQIVYKDSLLYEGEDILGSFKDGEKIHLSKVIFLMLGTSDNTASLWLQKLAGTGTQINELLVQNGFIHTRVNSKTICREQDRSKYGWGQTTPNEMVLLFEKLYKGQIISDSISKKMIRMLGKNYWDDEAISAIPPTIFVASKNGAVDASRSETLLVMAKQPYIVSICTKNNIDKRYDYDNEAWVLTRKLSKLIYTHFSK